MRKTPKLYQLDGVSNGTEATEIALTYFPAQSRNEVEKMDGCFFRVFFRVKVCPETFKFQTPVYFGQRRTTRTDGQNSHPRTKLSETACRNRNLATVKHSSPFRRLFEEYRQLFGRRRRQYPTGHRHSLGASRIQSP